MSFSRSLTPQWTYEIVTCAIVSLIASLISSHFCYRTLLLSSVVTLLPGYTATASAVEILTKNVVAGATRLGYTLVYLTAMSYGLTLAPIFVNAAIGKGFDRRPLGLENACGTEQTIVVDPLWLILCVPVYIVSYNVYLKVCLLCSLVFAEEMGGLTAILSRLLSPNGPI